MAAGTGAIMGHKGSIAGSLEEVTPEPEQMETLGHGISQPLHGDASCGGLSKVSPNPPSPSPNPVIPVTVTLFGNCYGLGMI
jgi:hypothetical protein